MQRRALVIALLVAASCNKESPPPGAPASPATAAASVAPPQAPAPAPAPGSAGPHAPAAAPPPPRTLDKLADGRLVLGPFSLVVPADWTAKPVASSMRAAAFAVPGKAGADAELIVYYFGAGGAGGIDANLDRWLGQFVQPDGKKSRDVAKIETSKLAGLDVTTVSVAGRFVAPAMPGGSDMVDKPDQALLGAIVASPSGPYYWKLVGPRPTVDGQAAAFRAMLGSLKLR
jgi:hypothetical protein